MALGEIVDLTENKPIEMIAGDEISIIKNRGMEGKELWFYLDSTNEDIEIFHPTDKVPAEF